MSAQLQAFRKLIRIAARLFFQGEVDGVTREDPSLELERGRPKRNQIDQKDLVVVVVDALSYREWVSVDKFAEQIHMSAKQVRKVLHYLEAQGFVVREHRREKRKGNKVESVDDPFAAPEKGQTSSYVAIDYPHFFDMLRLRMYLANKALEDKIDDKEAVKKYVCGPDTNGRMGCGAKYTSFTIMGLPITEGGLLRCNVCDFGVVEPEIAGKSAAGWRIARDRARSQRLQLKEVFKELEELVAKLQDVDPPDFGSFTDWVQARKDKQRAAAAVTGTRGGGGGARGGALDYGIDGPPRDASINITHVGEAEAGAAMGLAEPSVADPRASLPYFMKQNHSAEASAAAAAAASQQDASTSGAQEEAVQAEEQQAVYEAYVKQYLAQVAAIQAQQAPSDSKDSKPWKEGLTPESAMAIMASRETSTSPGDEPPAKRVKLEPGSAAPSPSGTPGAGPHIPPPSPGEMPFAVPPATPNEAEVAASNDGEAAFDWEEAAPAVHGSIPTPEDAFDWEDT